MKACVIYRDKLGDPRRVFSVQDVPVPEVEDDEILVKLDTSMLPHNTAWIARGIPINVVKTDYHIGGSGGVGNVMKIGSGVHNFHLGEKIFITCNMYVNNNLRILGYETPRGTFAEYCVVKDYMCVHMPGDMHRGAACVFNNVASSWQMLFGWDPHVVQAGDVVLIWGASGSIGSIAVHLVQKHGGIPVAVTSSPSKQSYCKSIGAAHVLDRREYPHLSGDTHDSRSLARFIRDVRKSAGKLPRIVFEHTGSDTMNTSIMTCDKKGMVVLCGATSGYKTTIDVRRVWVPQKRIQGSHYYDQQHTGQIVEECKDSAFNKLVTDDDYTLEDIGEITSLMEECPRDKKLNNIIINIG